MSKKATLITPNYNSETFIEETSNSILGQRYPYWEWIIIDDGSTDNSPAYLKDLANAESRIRFFYRDRGPRGPSTCRNIGIKKALGDYVIFLDADDFLADFCLEQRIKYMEANPELDFAVFKMQWFNPVTNTFNGIKNHYTLNKNNYLHLFLQGIPPWQTSCPVWKRAAIESLGGFNEQLIRNTDPDLHARALLQENIAFDVLQDVPPDCFYRHSPGNEARFQHNLPHKIHGTIQFYKNLQKLVNERTDKETLLASMRKGIIQFYKFWLLSRIAVFNKEATAFLSYCRKSNLLTKRDFLILRLLMHLWRKDYAFIRLLRIKGLLNSLLP